MNNGMKTTYCHTQHESMDLLIESINWIPKLYNLHPVLSPPSENEKEMYNVKTLILCLV